MSASLVGSEMCIRDRWRGVAWSSTACGAQAPGLVRTSPGSCQNGPRVLSEHAPGLVRTRFCGGPRLGVAGII
eukprot:8956816-Alexandrium_andersonii.AAC.1